MSVDVVDSVLAAARKEGGWDDTNKRKESLLDDTEEAGNEFHRVMVPKNRKQISMMTDDGSMTRSLTVYNLSTVSMQCTLNSIPIKIDM
ncbi:hypothetical protein PRIPAC_81451 [Pristionchus pacificus]|uniref:Uncharacterized protein n=1 Tax=Pristionchus pacificus TaxID=54126 RepID=A0A2A6BYS0_PRIPA|nr:hypothetical protein PRIPAC_81451 [Pristionchus pacificus]|eukprot:PDM70977.1 hypothetical protein PRIPAC_44373 [Pristionchus pacificus]